MENLRHFFQSECLLTQLLAEAVAMEWWKRKTRDYHQKLNVRVASRIAEQFRTNNLKKWGTFKAAYLSFHWFNDSWIWTRSSWIWTRNSWIWTRNLWIGTRNSWIWTRTFEFQLVLLRFELVTRNSCFTHITKLSTGRAVNKTKCDMRFRAKVKNNDVIKISPDLEKYSTNVKTQG